MRWRRHRRLVLGFAAGLVALVAAFGGSGVTAITTGDARPGSEDVGGEVALFDDSFVHEIELEYDEAEYRRMIRAYERDGSKIAIRAAITIDGTRLEQVAIRLKGNSTLRPLGGGGFRGGPPRGGGGRFGFGGLRGGGPPASADEPERLPLLVEFDAFVEGRRYEGYEAVAIRPGGMVTGATALNEALALRLIASTGAAAPQSMYASYSVNGGEPVLRLVLEEPDRPFAEDHFRGDGVLYKSLSTGSFDYLGDDPLAYGASFRQATRSEQGLRPVIALIRWTAQSSDAAFAAGLRERVDVDALARYAALHSLLLDFDDMSGPGQNYYLWYDLDAERFTVVSWDLNFAFSGNPSDPPFAGRGLGRGGFARGGHPLKQRFLRTPAFRRLALAAHRELGRELFAGGRALEELDRLDALLASTPVLDRATREQEVGALRRVIRERTAALARG
jgi:spore coat protein CotH